MVKLQNELQEIGLFLVAISICFTIVCVTEAFSLSHGLRPIVHGPWSMNQLIFILTTKENTRGTVVTCY